MEAHLILAPPSMFACTSNDEKKNWCHQTGKQTHLEYNLKLILRTWCSMLNYMGSKTHANMRCRSLHPTPRRSHCQSCDCIQSNDHLTPTKSGNRCDDKGAMYTTPCKHTALWLGINAEATPGALAGVRFEGRANTWYCR